MDRRKSIAVDKEILMQAIVVYKSHWGNTEAVARAIAEGIGTGARALTTDEATSDVVAGADLVVAGAPVIAFSLPRAGAATQLEGDTKAPRPADVSHPMLRTWLDALPAGRGWYAAFETRIWWSPRGATGTDRVAVRQGRLPEEGQGRAVHRRGCLRTAPRGRARTGTRVGRDARRERVT